MKNNCILSLMLFIFSTNVAADTNSEAVTAQYFEKIKNNPKLLLIFLRNMPKGGDLHSHLGGVSLAENMIHYSLHDRLCVNPNNYNVRPTVFCSADYKLTKIKTNSALYNAIIDAWSMRNFHPGKESGHAHFFATFNKFYPIMLLHKINFIAEAANRAARQNELYLELMDTPDLNASGMLGKFIGWNPNLAELRKKLLNSGLSLIVKHVSKSLANNEKKLQELMLCNTEQPQPGCKVKIRYLYQVLREQAPENVFAQLLAGFELANKNHRIVGINMVQPEDGVIAIRDYKLHMQMVGFLHRLYPNVNISLHAGELTKKLVPLHNLRFHINDAIRIAHAKRIGHGIDIVYENNANELLNNMKKNNILVEINLSSNEQILGIAGKDHPLSLYLHHNVPLALSTDDEGILRTDLTHQYHKAVLTYGLSYPTLKNIARNSLSYSFLPGQNLWLDASYKTVNKACAKDNFTTDTTSALCRDFLNSNEKAQIQWDLERRFIQFENKIPN